MTSIIDRVATKADAQDRQPHPGAVDVNHLRDPKPESTLRPSYEVKAQSKLDEMNLSEKASLTPAQSDGVRKMEGALLSGDYKSFENLVHSYKANPDEAKPMMDVLAKDLNAAGLRATYDVDGVANLPGKSGMLDIATNPGLQKSRTGGYEPIENESLTVYTNGDAHTSGTHNDADQGPGSSQKIAPELAFKAVSNQLAINLTEEKYGQ